MDKNKMLSALPEPEDAPGEISAELDLKISEIAMKEHTENSITYTLDEAEKELGL